MSQAVDRWHEHQRHQRREDQTADGALKDAQAKIAAPIRPPEALFDLQADPYELNNLATDPKLAADGARLRQTLDAWIRTAGGRGQLPKPPAVYDSEMAAYLNKVKRNVVYADIVRKNIALIKRWPDEGR